MAALSTPLQRPESIAARRARPGRQSGPMCPPPYPPPLAGEGREEGGDSRRSRPASDQENPERRRECVKDEGPPKPPQKRAPRPPGRGSGGFRPGRGGPPPFQTVGEPPSGMASASFR